jgi:hypothetical protein
LCTLLPAISSLLVAGLPAYIAMLVTGEWLTSKEGFGGEDDPAWFLIGIFVGDLTGLLLAVPTSTKCWPVGTSSCITST